MNEFGIYAKNETGRMVLIPLDDSSEYKVYAINPQIIWWWKSETENTLGNYGEVIKESE